MKIIKINKKTVRKFGPATGVFALIIVILIVFFALSSNDNSADISPKDNLPVVRVTTAQKYAGESTINLIGTVRAFSEAAITAETSGRVTGVRVSLGDAVSAGQIIATIENASEQAAVLQAEGSYDAAVAISAQNEVGSAESETNLNSKKNSAISTIRTSYNTVEGIVYNNIDQFFNDPDRPVPGLKLPGEGETRELNDNRVLYQDKLPNWQTRINNLNNDSDLDSELQFSKQEISDALNFVSIFIKVLNDQESFIRYSQSEITAFANTFNTLRSDLINAQSSIDTAAANLDSARDTVARAQISAAGGVNSAADAQVKQSLGSLRAAQANLAKTIIRTPISGTVNNLSARTGDFISAQSQIAEVANNNALEIVTFVGSSDVDVISVGDSVMIEDKFNGTVTEIAPAIDSATGKTELRIASESSELQNGDTVRISKLVESELITNTIVSIPLSAIKFQLDDGSIFVIDNGELVLRPVKLGTIRGGSGEITEGLSMTEEFVIDARGLVEGTKVEIIK
jgi:multidrug efflux pump subunit AcrA (membrane-fusion protein)